MKYDNVIAVDPDVDKSGVAYLRVATRELEVTNLSFPDLLDYLNYADGECKNANQTLVVVVEAGWLNQSNWHVRSKDNVRIASAKGNSTGRNHEVGRKIVEMCRHYGIDVVEKKPLVKCWKGPGGKITQEELNSFTGLAGRNNQDARDAALLAWEFANLPIRVKVK